MQDRVQFLNVAVNIAATKTASDATIKCLEEESSKVVYFVNSETLFLLEEKSDWRETIEASELVLPGTVSVNKSINEVLGHKRDSFFLESYFDNVLDYAVENGKELFIIAEKEEHFLSIQEHIQEKRPFITLSGVFLTEQEESADHVVNEINSVAPDILLVALEERKQLFLLENHRHQINAGLFLSFKGRRKLKKLLKNLLTKTSDCDIITKPTERDRQDEQKSSQERLAKLCRITKAH